jgi:hypothetical protein
MGLETAHPEALRRLEKRLSLDEFAAAAEALCLRGVALRVFLMVGPPFVPAVEQEAWLERSVAFAFDCGASVVSLIPTRGGNAPLDALVAAGEFALPQLSDLERAVEAVLPGGRGRVLADLWDLERFARCPQCLPPRHDRLQRANLEQVLSPPVACDACAGA